MATPEELCSRARDKDGSSRDREQEARAIMAKYHGNGDPEHEVVRLEMEEMSEAIDTTGSDKSW
jgi:hypothetical protein